MELCEAFASFGIGLFKIELVAELGETGTANALVRSAKVVSGGLTLGADLTGDEGLCFTALTVGFFGLLKLPGGAGTAVRGPFGSVTEGLTVELCETLVFFC